MEDWEQCPSWLARSRRRWLQSGFSGQCLGAPRRSAPRHTTSHRVGPARRRGTHDNNGLADPPDPPAGGLGFGHRRMVLRPRPEHVRQRVASLHLAVPAVFPLHPLHGELLRLLHPEKTSPCLTFFCQQQQR